MGVRWRKTGVTGFRLRALVCAALALAWWCGSPVGAVEPRKVVLIAGRPSHPPRMHEFNAGVQLLAKCLKQQSAIQVVPVLNGWPADEATFDGAAAVTPTDLDANLDPKPGPKPKKS